MTKLILWFDELSNKDVSKVGGKNASLGEMYRQLSKKGVRVPNGFAITAQAYQYMIKEAGIEKEIKKLLNGLDVTNIKDLGIRGAKVRKLIREAKIPEKLEKEIREAYKKLSKKYKTKNAAVAVRSSATAEDLPTASFAGQQETYLNIHSEEALLEACRRCFASLFTNRAIAYRQEKKFSHLKVYLSIGVQKMVESESSGVMFTLDTDTGFKDVVYITGAWGLGENVVQGAVNPDEWYVFKPTLKQGKEPILSKDIGSKLKKMIYTSSINKPTKNIPTTKKERQKYVLNDKEVLLLSKWACIIEEHYTKLHKIWTPMDIEWAKDKTGLYIVQARPETVESQKGMHYKEYIIKEKGNIICEGKAVGKMIGAGKANIIKEAKDIGKFKEGEVLVTDITDPDWVPIMKKAAAIVTDKGGRTSHAAIVSRELGLPCIVGTGDGTKKIKQGQKITVSSAEGEDGIVYDGIQPFEVRDHDLEHFPKTKTKVMMNVGNPESAFKLAGIPNHGVGLARLEFIINDSVKVHPLALLNYKRLKPKERKAVNKATEGYKNKSQFFIDKVASGVATIAAAFYPNEVIVRLSDFKSNEYANLIAGKNFEPHEENPMIGWRGASRYYSPKYENAFTLECKAMKKVREEMGLTNVKLMVPFCRTPEEGKNVLKVMEKNGLKRGKNDLEVYVMCELPSNVMMADEFAKIFDGFSIGSNDLTQLTLGLDRDSALVSHLFDERNPAVQKMIAMAIKSAKKNKKKIGICGDAPSTYPKFAKFLVEQGIDSISLSPDAVISMALKIAKFEKKI